MSNTEAKGIFWNSLGSTMYGANTFIMLAMVSRFGTVEQAGDFGIAFTTAQILYIIGLMGISQYQMTDYSEKYRFVDYMCTRIFSSVLMLISGMCACCVMHFAGDKLAYTVWLTVLMLLNVIGELYQSFLFQKNRLDLSGSMLFYRTFWPLLIFCGSLFTTHNTIFAIAAQTVCNLCFTCCYIRFVSAKFTIAEKFSPSCKAARNLSVECLPLFICTLLMSIMLNASKYGVEFFLDDVAQGIYNLIFIPAQIIDLCSRFLFMPFLHQYEQLFLDHKNKKLVRMLIWQIVVIALFTAGCCVIASWFGIPVLEFIYHKDISDSVIPLILIILGGGIFAVCQLCYWLLTTFRRQWNILIVYLIALFVMPPATIIAIKRWRLEGAAISFIIVHVVIAICDIYMIYQALRKECFHA